jgi:ribonucleoside-diphosphate reductase beta chain
MAEDVKDWKKKLTEEEKAFLTNIFRFFTQGDIDVAGGYVNNYLPYFKQPEVRMMLLGFSAREALHVAAYSHLIETLGLPETQLCTCILDTLKNSQLCIQSYQF